MPASLTGKRALITASSRGLGRSIALLLSSHGVRCAINYANNKAAAEDTLRSLEGEGHVLVQGDVFSRDGAVGVCKAAKEALGGIDLVASNAGWTAFADFYDINALDDATWDRTYAANVKSHLWIMQALQDELSANKGSFLLTASIAGLNPAGSSMPYSVSKAATIHLGKSLARACGPKNIRVNILSPGLILTDWANEGFTPEQIERFISGAALKKASDLDDLAEMAVMILRNESMTGENVVVNAGLGLA